MCWKSRKKAEKQAKTEAVTTAAETEGKAEEAAAGEITAVESAEEAAADTETAEGVSAEVAKKNDAQEEEKRSKAAGDAGYSMLDDIEKVLLSAQELSDIVSRLGAEISRDYVGRNPLLVSVLKGSVITMADLMRAISIPCEIDFMVVSSYGKDTSSNGEVRIIKDLNCSIEGRDLIIVEDILDSGNTLSYLRDILERRGASSIKICTLLDKPGRRERNISADYVGTVIENGFVVGYGLDFAEKYRNLPFVGILKRKVYDKDYVENAE